LFDLFGDSGDRFLCGCGSCGSQTNPVGPVVFFSVNRCNSAKAQDNAQRGGMKKKESNIFTSRQELDRSLVAGGCERFEKQKLI
jgi:hypothetical protein